ncbi:MAG: DUF4412 domain-containing protein [Deltaproteobacteria bacterium]|nr:DUF4412 domain-containing protein [Deltaproteobacteria bacterium]
MIRPLITAFILSLCMATGAISAEFSADLLMQSVGGTHSGKLYFKNEDLNRIEMMGIISISKRPMTYQLFPDTKKYVVTNIDEISKNNPAADAANFKEWIENNNLKKTGTDTLEGYKCDIFEGDVKLDDDQPPVHMKIWHTPELGYPIRQESTLPQPVGKISSHLKNIQLESQAGSLFEIPAGYSQAKDVQEAMGMPSFGDGGKGQAPSQEEMQKMMKDMMKKMGQE